MPSNIKTTKAMLKYAKAHGLKIPKVSTVNPYWGKGKRTLAWRVSGHAKIKQSAKKTKALVWLLFPRRMPKLRIIGKSYRWARPLVNRSGKPKGIVWHNAAATHCTADDVHRWHLANGWSGIAYHFFVTKTGKVYRGRPEDKLGGHTLHASDWLGVCCEGNYDKEYMPSAQLKACQSLHRYLHRKYNWIPDRKHRDMPGNSTSCPGKHYPFGKIVSVK